MHKVAGILVRLVISGVLILLASFLLLKLRPGDPLLSLPGLSGNSKQSIRVNDQRYNDLIAEYGLNLPVFYFSVSNAAVPDSFNCIVNPSEKSFLINLSRETGRPDVIVKIRDLLLQSKIESNSFTPDAQWIVARELLILQQVKSIIGLRKAFQYSSSIMKLERVPTMKSWEGISSELEMETHTWRQWIPMLNFHPKNQCSEWCKGWFLVNDSQKMNLFAKSRMNNLSVIEVIKKPFCITLIISFLAMVLSVVLAVPAACELVIHRKNKWSDRISNTLLFLYSVPVFWMAILMLIFFASPVFLDIFPTSGIEPLGGFSEDASVIKRILIGLSYYVLPVIALSYGGIIFFIRLLRNGLLSELQKEYIVTARASGYDERKVVYKYALKNAFYSSLTLIWITFPALLSGSVLIENVFSIPGMGSLLIRSVQNQDQPVLIGMFMLIGVITSLSFVLLDIVQSAIDPRLKIDKGGLNE